MGNAGLFRFRTWSLPRRKDAVHYPESRFPIPDHPRPASGRWAGLVAVRDSKNTAGPALLFDPDAWEGFITTLR